MATVPPISDLSFATLTVSVTTGFRIRKAIGLWLIRLACFVMRCGVEIKDMSNDTGGQVAGQEKEAAALLRDYLKHSGGNEELLKRIGRHD